MNDQDKLDPVLQARVRTALDASADDLDMVTASRLRAARHRALGRAGRRQPWATWWTVAVPAGATAALVAALLYTPAQDTSLPTAPPEVVRDLDLLTASDGLEFYQDLEFFRWLPPEQRS